MTRFGPEQMMALGLMAAAVFLLFYSQSFPLESRIFPTIVLGLMTFLAAVVLVRSYLRPEKDPLKDKPFFIHRNRFIAAFVCILAYIAALPVLGYFTSSAIFFIFVTVLLGYRNWKMLFPTMIIFLAFVYAVFVALFDRPIPPEFFQSY